jgi:hypothetical protein
MDHREARELLELAAAEPDGLERLAAGDTPDSIALAGHLAGCAECSAVFEAIGREADSLRTTIRVMPPADLRARTLALVAATGRPRGAAAIDGMQAVGEPRLVAVGTPEPAPRARRRISRWAFVAAAAGVVAAVGIAAWWTTSSMLEAERQATAGLGFVTAATFRVQSQPDAQLIPLGATSGAATPKGELSYSGSSTEVVVIAEGLSQPASGEYGCWVEVDGVRRPIGPMHHGGELAYWAGKSDAVRGLEPGAHFGVSLVTSDGGAPSEPVLIGEL